MTACVKSARTKSLSESKIKFGKTQYLLFACNSCGILTSVNSKPREQLIAEWARRLKRMGLSSTTLALLPLLRPLGALGSQFVWFGQPMVRGLADETLLTELALLLEDPEALAELEQQLEMNDRFPAQ